MSRLIQEDTYQDLLRFITSESLPVPVGWSPIRVYNLFQALASAPQVTSGAPPADNASHDPEPLPS